MNNFTSELVDDLAKKLLIGLSPEENQMVLDEFAIIDENLAKVANFEGLNEVEPMTHCLDDFTFELREDEIENSVPIEDLLRNSDQVLDREIEVPKVVG
jgi:aspartyl/glutamyl-tRNA(Asn/Gln) amidotransferase C subunit